ncbi:MAG: hypothetical protein IPO21_17310 [Bacteroidales bacterium]|nr:hypothetical protein [Bacteroidales bacterium]
MCYSLHFIIIVVACFGFTFCSSESKELKYPEQTMFSSVDTVTKQNLLLYSLPNPLSVSYIIHTAQIDFNEKYLSQYQSEIIVGEVEKEKRATQLGFLLVEYGYLTFYEKQQYSLSYVKKIEELLRMLDLQNQKTIQAVGLLKSNMTNRDSINQLILNTYEDLGLI